MKLSQPVFILGPPRSGSTLLFETLSRCHGLWSLGDEGHEIIEKHKALTPEPFSDQSNRLTEQALTPELAKHIKRDFLYGIKDRNGARPTADQEEFRLLEKTPKNILRIPFLLALFPDARFIYLYRDARENISSIIDGWRSGRFRTYLDKQTPHGLWSFLVPPDWTAYRNKSLADIACFQWRSCHQFAMQDLANLPDDRWCAVNFQTFLDNTESEVERLCHFMGVSTDQRLRDYCRAELPRSRYTLTNPARDKWRHNSAELGPVMAAAGQLAKQLNVFIADRSPPLDTDIMIARPDRETPTSAVRQQSRNRLCDCGSGKRYKHCHGRL